jgi:hypothetical protein
MRISQPHKFAQNPENPGSAQSQLKDSGKNSRLNLEGFGTISSTTPGTGTTELFELSLDSASALTSSQASSFTLATLMFNAVATGTSALTLSVNALGDQNGNPISASLQNGSVTISSAPPVPLPASAWLLLSGLGSLAMLVQRGKLRRA